MLQNIDESVRCVVEEFVDHAWVISNIRDSYVSIKPRNRASMPGGGVLMWGMILVGYFLVMIPLMASLSIVATAFAIYFYYDLSFFKDRDHIYFCKHNDAIICTGASIYEQQRIKKICLKYKVNVIFEKSYRKYIVMSRWRYYRRY